MIKRFLILWLCFCSVAYSANNRNTNSVKALAVIQCASCHSVDGNSQSSLWPTIAGLNQAYLLKQLKDFKNGIRVNKEMEGITQSLSLKDLTALSYFFSQQNIKPLAELAKPTVNNNLINLNLGKEIYLGKRIEYGIPACASCHGERGQGGFDLKRGYTYPRLAWQYQQYSIKQLKLFRASKRSNDSPAMMRNIASMMDDEDIESVMAYVATFNSEEIKGKYEP